MTIEDLPNIIREYYEVREWRHASAVLARDFPAEWRDLIAVLTGFRLKKSAVMMSGGNKSSIANDVDAAFAARGWVEKQFKTEIVVDDRSRQSPTHKVDYYKNHVGIEMEWNNKDPFYDRDLNNFRLLFDLQAISVGVIITRCDELQEVFDALGKGKSYGPSTTHMSRLIPRLEGGAGGGCPILVFGITRKLYVEDV